MCLESVSAQGVPLSPTCNDPTDVVLKQVVSSFCTLLISSFPKLLCLYLSRL